MTPAPLAFSSGNALNARPPIFWNLTSHLYIKEIAAYRQQTLHNLTCAPQSNGAHRKRELQYFAPRSLKNPVERECEEKKGNKMEDFVGLLVRRDRIVWG